MRVFHLTGSVAAVAAALCLTLGCDSVPRSLDYVTSGEKPVTSDGLHQVRFTRVGGAFVKPEADFSGYHSVIIDPVTVAYKKDPESSETAQRARGNVELDEAGMARLKQIYQENFEREFSASESFATVYEPAPGVMRVSGHIVNLVVNVPPSRGGEYDYLTAGGEMTLILDVRDSQTLDPLTRLIDRRPIQPASSPMSGGGYRSDAVSNWGAVRDLCSNWARVLENWLGDLRMTRVPPAPAG